MGDTNVHSQSALSFYYSKRSSWSQIGIHCLKAAQINILKLTIDQMITSDVIAVACCDKPEELAPNAAVPLC